MQGRCNENLRAVASVGAELAGMVFRALVTLMAASPSVPRPSLPTQAIRRFYDSKPCSLSWVKLSQDTTHKTSPMEDAVVLHVAQPPARSALHPQFQRSFYGNPAKH